MFLYIYLFNGGNILSYVAILSMFKALLRALAIFVIIENLAES